MRGDGLVVAVRAAGKGVGIAALLLVVLDLVLLVLIPGVLARVRRGLVEDRAAVEPAAASEAAVAVGGGGAAAAGRLGKASRRAGLQCRGQRVIAAERREPRRPGLQIPHLHTPNAQRSALEWLLWQVGLCGARLLRAVARVGECVLLALIVLVLVLVRALPRPQPPLHLRVLLLPHLKKLLVVQPRALLDLREAEAA